MAEAAVSAHARIGTGRGADQRTRGVVFTPAELQYEGLERVLGDLAGSGVNAVAVTPGVFLPGDPESGVREPPLDVDGEVRQLDRPLWGSRVAYVQRFAPYEPDPQIWAGLPYPSSEQAPPGHRADMARQMIDEARRLQMRPYIIISPTILPGLPGGHSMSGGIVQGEPHERPLPVGGRRSKRIIAGQGCPNNPSVRDLVVARVRETVKHYGDAAGLFLDWIEYTCYFPEDAFTCFCRSCERTARAQGVDWPALEEGVRALWSRLQRLTDVDLRAVIDAGTFRVLVSLADCAAIEEHQRFKATSVAGLYDLVRRTAVEAGAPGLSIGANGFPGPFSTVTGADFAVTAGSVDVVRPKFFTFHWAMMVRWYGETLMQRNPHLDESLVVAAMLSVFGISGGGYDRSLASFGMPKPGQSHPLSVADVRRKVEDVVTAVGHVDRCEAYIHSYQPVDDLDNLVRAMDETDVGGVWVQRYGYLSDAKLDRLRSRWNDGR